MSYILGLDIGSKSIGWSLLSDKPKRSIIDIGVRVFPEGVDRDTKGAEKSKSATRREARGARRTHTRRNLRRDKLVKTLRENGLLPESDEDLRKLLSEKDPYQIRAMGLDEKLDLHEFGRALFHINQRRGFKSNRKTGKAKDEGKVVAKEAGELQQRINEADCRTLGEYYAGLDPEEIRIRNQYTFRSMYEYEFDLLWKKQTEFYPDIITKDLYKKIRDEVIFYQRPLKPTDELIGMCELEPDEKRCPRGDWYARRFRILQDVNNLKIHNPDGSEDKLTQEQRKIILQELVQKKEIKFDKIRKLLGLIESQEFNLEQGDKVKSLKGDSFAAGMRSRNLFGAKKWDSLVEKEKIELNNAFLELEDDKLVEKMVDEYGFKKEQAERVLKISLPQRYMSFSRKAIMRLLPFMESGALTSDAKEKAGYKKERQETGESLDKLPLPHDLRNPIVQKAMHEVRKVVNAIIREYGKPKKIVLEMARDVKGGMREREEIQFKMRQNEKRNDEARTRLIQDMNILNPRRDDIIKYNLWKECGKICPYTGKTISQAALFGSNPEFQVEHILPYDRSLDDSYMNKTLCHVIENRKKGNQTPYEKYSHDEEKYEQIKQRIKALPWPKRRKFLQKEINLDECINRELNDTRYICKEVVGYLRELGVSVRGTKGRITSELRHQWGLNNILDLSSSDMKNRDDHRHHSIDAVVVAVTKNEHLRNLAKSKYSKVGSIFQEPWPNFREELEEKVKHIDVSHRVTRKVSGALHEETHYWKEENGPHAGKFITSKPLDGKFTKNFAEHICDDTVKKLVFERLSEYDYEPKKAFAEPIYLKNKSGNPVPIRKVRVWKESYTLKKIRGKIWVEPGSNHHIEIYEYTDGKKKGKRDGEVVTMFEAVRRKKDGEPVVNREHGPDKKYVCSLSINEMFTLESDNREYDLCRIQKMSQNKTIVLRPHTFAGDLKKQKPINKTPNSLKGHKVTVDPLGRIYPAND
jgi:CRISPR-associated endonuclease Csn1